MSKSFSQKDLTKIQETITNIEKRLKKDEIELSEIKQMLASVLKNDAASQVKSKKNVPVEKKQQEEKEVEKKTTEKTVDKMTRTELITELAKHGIKEKDVKSTSKSKGGAPLISDLREALTKVPQNKSESKKKSTKSEDEEDQKEIKTNKKKKSNNKSEEEKETKKPSARKSNKSEDEKKDKKDKSEDEKPTNTKAKSRTTKSEEEHSKKSTKGLKKKSSQSEDESTKSKTKSKSSSKPQTSKSEESKEQKSKTSKSDESKIDKSNELIAMVIDEEKGYAVSEGRWIHSLKNKVVVATLDPKKKVKVLTEANIKHLKSKGIKFEQYKSVEELERDVFTPGLNLDEKSENETKDQPIIEIEEDKAGTTETETETETKTETESKTETKDEGESEKSYKDTEEEGKETSASTSEVSESNSNFDEVENLGIKEEDFKAYCEYKTKNPTTKLPLNELSKILGMNNKTVSRIQSKYSILAKKWPEHAYKCDIPKRTLLQKGRMINNK